MGSIQPPATQATHARRGSAQFRSFINFLPIEDARGRLPGRPPNSESRHLQPDNAARRARRCIRTTTRSPPVKPVPATVHGEGVRLQYYLISALRGVNPLTPFPPRRSGGMAENGISLPFARGALPRPSRCSHRSIRSPGGSENGRRHFPAIFLWIASPPRRVLGSWSGCEINR